MDLQRSGAEIQWAYLRKYDAMRSDKSDITWLGVGIIDRRILLDAQLQGGVGSGRGTSMIANILCIDDMFSDVKWEAHCVELT